MRYKIVTDTNEYIITESENAIIIETHNSLQEFLLDLDCSIKLEIKDVDDQ